MRTLNILNLKKEARYLHDTLSGYVELIELLQKHLSSGEDTIDAVALEEYLHAYRLQHYANRIMSGASLLTLSASRRYDIEELLSAISSLLPPLRDVFYGDYMHEEEFEDPEEGAKKRP